MIRRFVNQSPCWILVFVRASCEQIRLVKNRLYAWSHLEIWFGVLWDTLHKGGFNYLWGWIWDIDWSIYICWPASKTDNKALKNSVLTTKTFMLWNIYCLILVIYWCLQTSWERSISLSHYGQNLPFLGYCLSSLKSSGQLKQCE